MKTMLALACVATLLVTAGSTTTIVDSLNPQTLNVACDSFGDGLLGDVWRWLAGCR